MDKKCTYILGTLAAVVVGLAIGPAMPAIGEGRAPGAAVIRQIAPAPEQASTSSLDMLRRMLNADRSLTSEGDVVVELDRGIRPIRSTQHVIRDGDRGLKILSLTPPRVNGSYVIDNGTTEWSFSSARDTLVTRPSRLRARSNRSPLMLRAAERGNLILTILGTDSVAGRPCTMIEVRRRQDPGPWRVYWVDDETGFPHMKDEQHSQDGRLLQSSYYTHIQFGVSIPDGTFSPPPTPIGTTVQSQNPERELTPDAAEREAGFSLLVPGYIPAGYHPQPADVWRLAGRSVIQQRYINGLNSFTLSETPAFRPNMMRIDHPRPNVSTTVLSGMRIVLVGDLPHPEAQHIIRSLH
ncbi:MAG: sigma-E factor regulatory protein RseB domain-containing protein [Capsulimonadaceae bacterium]